MSDGAWSKDARDYIDELMNSNRSNIPGLGTDTLVPGTPINRTFDAFNTSGRYIGSKSKFGAALGDDDRFFFSTREPVVKWFVEDVAIDMWDNWFRVMDVKKKDDLTLNELIQPVLEDLNSRKQFTRLTKFERRYGTSILLLAFEQQLTTEEFLSLEEGATIWSLPAYDITLDGEIAMREGVGELLQLQPYPRTNITNIEVDSNPSSLRFGLPEFYTINRMATTTNTSSAFLTTGATLNIENERSLKVHWTRLIHDAANLDEHPYLGISRVDIMFDDAVGFRNGKWGQYQTLFRYGSGFPVLKTKATRKENETWMNAGGFKDMNARMGAVIGIEEDFDFKGVQGSTLNPTPYNDLAYTNFAAATRISQDVLKGVSAGRVTGSEVNERSYIRFISTQQNESEFIPRDLIDILIATGQVEFEGEYIIEFMSAFQINQQDEAAIGFMEARENELLLTYMTLNEVREKNGLPPTKGGDIVVGRAGQSSPERPPDFPANQNSPSTTGGLPEDPSQADVVHMTLKDGTKVALSTKSFFKEVLGNALK